MHFAWCLWKPDAHNLTGWQYASTVSVAVGVHQRRYHVVRTMTSAVDSPEDEGLHCAIADRGAAANVLVLIEPRCN
ncbi:unnamed protein product, partial [Iphiclides podalirius]